MSLRGRLFFFKRGKVNVVGMIDVRYEVVWIVTILELGWVSDGDMAMLVDKPFLYIVMSLGALESSRAAHGPTTIFKRGTRRKGIYVMMAVVHVPLFSNLPS